MKEDSIHRKMMTKDEAILTREVGGHFQSNVEEDAAVLGMS